MILLELISWLALAGFLAAMQLYLWDDVSHALRFLLAACGAAVVGGTLTRLSTINLYAVGGYSVASLLVAGLCALAALAWLGSRRRRPRTT